MATTATPRPAEAGVGSKFGKLVAAIDEGTSSARVLLFKAETAEVVCSYQKELSQKYPQEGWVEQDPMEILSVVQECIRGSVEKLISLGGAVTVSGIYYNINRTIWTDYYLCIFQDIAAVGVTNQRETTLVWDKTTGKPLFNAIVWLDMRTSSTMDQLLDTVPNKTRNKNYLKVTMINRSIGIHSLIDI